LEQKINCTGVLLVGGESRRMGKNKAFLEIEGKTLIERNLAVLDSVCAEVLISCREADLYSGYNHKIVTDVIKAKGPLGGLYSVLNQAAYDYVFLAACDMPFINAQAIGYLYNKCQGEDIVLFKLSGRKHTLHAFYHKRILPLVEKKLQDNVLSILDLIKECRVKVVDMDEENSDLNIGGLIRKSMINVNTPEEWETMVEKTVSETGVKR